MPPRRHTLEVHASGPLLLGGHSSPPAAIDAQTATDADGRPFVPASALKGAIREAAWRLARTAGRKACVAWEPCREDPCELCRIFGASGADRPELSVPDEDRVLTAGGGGAKPWSGGGLRLGNAVRTADEAPIALRHGVGIDRYTGRAVDGLLWRRLVAENGAGNVYRAEAWVDLAPADEKLLAAALAEVTSIGNSQSRGHGAVRLSLAAAAGAGAPGVEVSGAAPAGFFRVVVEAVEPLHLGGVPLPGSLRETLRYLPGSTLLGAIHGAARRTGFSDADSVALATGLSLSVLHPAPAGGGGEALPGPVPRCWLRCAECDETTDHSAREALTRWLAAEAGVGLPAASCAVCGGPLKPATGTVGRGSPDVRLVTRLARDPHLGSGAPGLLYAREQLDAGAQFVGTASGLDDGVRGLLNRLARSGVPILVGGLRGRGLGRVQVRFSAAPASRSVQAAVDGWRRLHRDPLDVAGGPGWRAERLTLVVARTPLSLRDRLTVDEALGAALGTPVAIHARWERREPRPLGWDDRKLDGAYSRPIVSAVRAGSAWLVESDPVPADRLLELSYAGLGEHREHGLGRLSFCPSP